MSTIKAIAPLWIVADVVRSVSFYKDVLGFECSLLMPEQDPFFAMVQRDGVELMLKAITPEVLSLPNPVRHPWAKWDAFVRTDDPDALAAELADGGAKKAFEVQITEDGLRGFEVTDVDGYVLFFGLPA